MSANVPCPDCGKVVEVPDGSTGKNVRCASCQTSFVAKPPRVAKDQSAATLPAEEEQPKPNEQSESMVRQETAPAEVAGGLPSWLTLEWRRIPVSLSHWLLVPIFFLPWINVSCNDHKLMSQTGLQTCLGRIRHVPRLEKIKEQNKRQAAMLREQSSWLEVDSTSKAYLIWVFASFVLLACFIGLVCIGCVLFRQHGFAAIMNLSSLICLALGFVLLVIQMIIGFPIEAEIADAKNKQEQIQQQQQKKGMGNIALFLINTGNYEQFFDIEVTYTNWFWAMFTYLLLLLPWLLLELVAAGFAFYRHASNKRHDDTEDG
jgi:LSD1 subclass zinc finger protein